MATDSVTTILAPLYESKKTIVEATAGTETFAGANDFVIGYIDPDYARLTKDRPAKPTQAKKANVMEMIQDADFKTMYGSLRRDNAELAWTNEEQVIKFCRAHKEKLNQSWWNFFLLEVEDNEATDENEKKKYFVARVCVCGRGLGASVRRFDDPPPWLAGLRPLVVVPQLQV